MIRRVPVFVTLLAVFLAGLTGCGIPGQTDVRVDGRGPLSGYNAEEGDGSPPPRREAATTIQEFVDNFLAAPAGEMSTAYERVNEYITNGKRLRAVGDETVINVVRLTDANWTQRNRVWEVTLSVQHIGALRADGTLGEPVAGERTYNFTVGWLEGNPGGTQKGSARRFFVLNPPPVLLMTDTALDTYYRRKMIYFWNADRTSLVPDLRYLPSTVPSRRKATEVLGWLIGGPARWLAPTVARLPEGTEAIGNVPDPQPNRRLEVNLSMPAEAVDDEAKLVQLFTQLAWSLPDWTAPPLYRPRDLELKIQGKSRKSANIETYRKSHPLYRVVGDPVRFGVHQGQVRSLDAGQDDAGQNLVPMSAEFNRGVLSAALNRDGVWAWAALVTGDRDGRQRLRTGAAPAPVREMRTSAESYRALGQPVWLKSSDPARPAGLIVADGKLKRFDVDAHLTEVAVPNLPAGRRLIAVAAGLDGHRIALVVEGGGLYVAAVGIEPDSVSVGPARHLATSLTDLTAVSWIDEDFLIVAGRKGDQVMIYRTSIDAARESVAVSEVSEQVTQLAAYPDNPVVRAMTGNVLYSAGNAIYFELEPLSLDPSTGTSGTALTSPFFYY